MSLDEYTRKKLAIEMAAKLRSEENMPGLGRVLFQQPFVKGRGARPLVDRPADDALAKPPRLGKVGIWEPKVENGRVSFFRNAHKTAYKLWADVEVIAPKGNKSRIVLLGESVARSIFIDPYFNCAAALRLMLHAASGVDDVEIIDMAKSGLMLSELSEMLVSTLAFEPDAYVIFAGNNWYPNEFALDLTRIASLLRDEGSWEPVQLHLEETIKEQIGNFVEYLGRFSAEYGVPVVFIIPEFNLLDWQLDASHRSPLISGDSIRRSLAKRALAEKALAEGNLHLALALAEQINEIEEGASPVGYQISSRCRLYQGRVAEARLLKEKAVDMVMWAMCGITPRCYGVTQEVLRRECATNGVSLVDLPRRFGEYLSSTLPGRRFFLDHCHMTVEGIRLAMAACVEKLLPLLGKPEQPWVGLNQLDFDIAPCGVANAHLLAARFNALCGQPYEVIRHHCAEAARQAPEVADLMRLYLNIQVCQNNVRYAREVRRLLGDKSRHGHGFIDRVVVNQEGRHAPRKMGNDEGLYFPLIWALTSLMSEADPTINTTVEDLLKQEHGVGPQEIDLLSRPCSDYTQGQPENEWANLSMNFRSYSSESSFRLICQFAHPVKVSLTCRVPGAGGEDRLVSLLVNGRLVHRFLAGAKWVTSDLVIPAEVLHEGVNSIIIHWPDSSQSRQERVEEVADRIEDALIWGVFVNVYRLYGEIHDFKARLWLYSNDQPRPFID